MNYFETLEKKRNHVMFYSDKKVDRELIEQALYKAWKTTPGKNNAMAYQALVWGPDKQEEKNKIYSLCTKSHKAAEQRAVDKGLNTRIQDEPNPFYYHIKDNQYLITMHGRKSTPNKFYQEQVELGHFYDQAHDIENIIDSVSVEIGLFLGNLGYYLLEQGLDISYNSTFSRFKEDWHKLGLMVEERPISMISIGYAKRYRKQELASHGKLSWDKKPDMKDIVKFV
mgnify:FL=1|tara:strand:+ start:2495 stop:3172 length:678 start_codon:yes stop_codon:yes gene_type:complete